MARTVFDLLKDMINKMCVSDLFRRSFIGLLCLQMALAPSVLWAQSLPASELPPLNSGSPKAAPRIESEALKRAKAVIEAAEARLMKGLLSPQDELDFAALVEANAVTQFVDDPKEFLEHFRKHKDQYLKNLPLAGQKPLNWQIFMAQAYTQYKIEKTQATQYPRKFIEWISKVVSNPYVEWASWKTWAAIVGVYLFVKGVASGALIAGPAAGAVNSALNPLVTPINQKLAVIGNKYLGRVGMVLNSWLFDGAAKKEAAEMEKAKEAVNGMRSILEGESYKISGENWSLNMRRLYKVWNHLGYLFSLVPDAYRGGRDLLGYLTIMRPKDFAQSATNSLNAAEVHRQGAESIVDRLIMIQPANASALQAVSESLLELAQKQIEAERNAPERVAEFSEAIAEGKAELARLGATAEQINRIFENYRKAFIFKRQAATVLAVQFLHDAMYAETLRGAQKIYNEMLNNHSLNYLHKEFKAEVAEILDRIDFKLDVKLHSIELEKSNPVKGDKEKALDRIMEINGDTAAKRSLVEPGSLLREGSEKPGGKAGRK